MPPNTSVPVDCRCDNAWCLLGHVYDKGGVGVLCFMFVAYIFYRMVWKVWQPP